ncbi:MAG: FHA domain-containing protein [Chthoniobacter sp.]|uniref:FHA domain-containing protein n=1 Tax=Chthoniobacter sp. TaxID=2510640 RepID=UPI0032A5B587
MSPSFDPHTAWLEFPSGERQFLSEKTTSIGRAPTSRLIIASERVSRNHAAIRWEEDGTYTLIDFGSSNGTFLNGQRVSRSVTLRNGWIVEIGLQKMIFRTVPSPNGERAGEPEANVAPCWLLALSATAIGCRTPDDELIGKTFESWSERAQRIVAKHRGRTMRGRDEGLIAYWPVQTADPRATTVVAAVRALGNVRQNEEFRLSLHFGSVNLRVAPTGEEAPAGPEVICAMQLDRFASNLRIPILLTEAAREALGTHVPTRKLGLDELRGYRGEQRYYTFAEAPVA